MQKNTKYCSTVKANVANINNTLKRNLGINKRQSLAQLPARKWIGSILSTLSMHYSCIMLVTISCGRKQLTS